MTENELNFLNDLSELLRKYDANISYHYDDYGDNHFLINIGDGGVTYHYRGGLCNIFDGLNANNIMNFDKD